MIMVTARNNLAAAMVTIWYGGLNGKDHEDEQGI